MKAVKTTVKIPKSKVRNAVARALAIRATSGAAGRHEKSRSAQRQEGKRALVKQITESFSKN